MPEDSLIDIGLTRTEAKIYLAGLTHGSLSVQEIGSWTGVKRPTIYHALGTLREKGLVTEQKTIGKSRYAMASPESVRGLLSRQKEKLDEQVSKLDALIPLLAGTNTDAVHVAQYVGIDGMKTVMDIAFYCRSRKWDIIAPYKNFLREYDKEYAQRYLNARKYHGITSRTLWEDGMRPDRKLTPEEIHERNPRLMPWAMHGKFKSMMFLFDDKVAIFSSLDKLSAILITSKEIHSLFSAMFEAIWEFSESY